MNGWIVVPRWDDFQHRDAARQSVPTWIKLHTRLLSDERFLSLSSHRRSLLICLWLEYARTRRELPDDTATLSRRLAQRVLRHDLEALNDAGFIHFSAGVPARDVAGSEEKRREGPPNPLLRRGDSNSEKTLSCRRCGAAVAPRSSCDSCGATARIAGTSRRALSEPPKRTAYERAESFVRNVGWAYDEISFESELLDFGLDDDERDTLIELRATLSNGQRAAHHYFAKQNPNPFIDE